ncbi:uncharacterized protein [Drosophila tropicalis]|uniref:uncharacterized protein n=1 Tax=Drosophila tropicalis TaxID=46794 RepID=UPI0035ABEF84
MRCCVFNCSNVLPSRNKSKSTQTHSSDGQETPSRPLSFFNFPKCPEAVKQWVTFCRNKNVLKLKNPIVCSEHFRDEDIQGSLQFEMGLCKRRTLKPGAVPCINKHDESESEKARKERSQRRENKKLVDELIAEAEALARAPVDIVPTPSYVRNTTGLASAPDFVSSNENEKEVTTPQIKIESDPLTTDDVRDDVQIKDKPLIPCRTCGKQFVADNEFKDLKVKDNQVLLFHIEAITGVWINCPESLPHHMCGKCVDNLRRAVEFRENCIRTEVKLNQVADEASGIECAYENVVYAETDPHIDALPYEEVIVEETQPTLVSNDDPGIALGNQIFENLLNEYSGDPELVKEVESTRRKSLLTKSTTIKSNVRTKAKDNKQTKSLGPKRTKEERNRIRREQIRAKPPSFVCDQCGLIFKLACNLQMHMLRHSRTMNYSCPECPRKFYDSYTRNIHVRVRHNDEKPYSCKYCSESFKASYQRQHHEKQVHNAAPRIIIHRLNVKPKAQPAKAERHYCTLCDKSYTHKYALAWHMNIHTGARPYKCKHCEKAFSEPAKAKRHEMTHDKRPLQCDVCLKGFFVRQKLKDHQLTHTGERPYKCDLCDVRFRYKHNANTHRISKMHKENLNKLENGDKPLLEEQEQQEQTILIDPGVDLVKVCNISEAEQLIFLESNEN